MKFHRITQAVKLMAAAGAVLVGTSNASEAVQAPVATYTATGYTAKEGVDLAELAELQARIQNLRDRGQTADADAMHEAMCRDLMVETWTEVNKNLVTTGGKNDLLDKYLAGSAYTAAWYCGLISSVSYTAVAVGDTMASHAGWLEAGPTNVPNYGAATRVALAFSAASAGSKATSSASSFTFSNGGTIKGMFACSVSTKDGTTGILYNAVLFTGGDRVVVNTDVVNVSVTYSA